MSSIFTKIIKGDLPAHFVYRDDQCVAFLSIAPLNPGHTLVVPVEERDHWLDLDPSLNAHLFAVCQRIGEAQSEIWRPAKVGLMIAGLEVPHVHIHVLPVFTVHDLDFSRADPSPDPEMMANAAERLSSLLTT